MISLRHAHDPASGKPIPEEERRLAADALAAVPTKDEELRHVEVLGIIGTWRASRSQRKTNDPGAVANEKRKPAFRLRPVERKLIVFEEPIGAQLETKSLTEIVRIQLQKVGEYPRVRRSREA
jgi:hypothetical protein